MITARDVIEVNDISGFKHIDVVGMESDELVPVHYTLTRRFMVPYEKLLLTTVSPDDQVVVEVTDLRDPMNLTAGEYVGNLFNALDRNPICRCGAPIGTDGSDIWCTNRDCGLTLLARLKRLAESRFFSSSQWSLPLEGFAFDGIKDFTECPFELILNPKTWNAVGSDMERIILDKNRQHVTLATFLVEEQFRAFLDASGSYSYGQSAEYKSVGRFYEMMDQIMFRREYESHIQNLFIKNLLWSFAIPGLDEDIINAMLIAETSMGLMDEVLLPYANYLSSSVSMQEDLHVDRMTADWITREFYLRRHEFFDIFTAYSTSPDIVGIFNNLNLSKRNLDEVFRLNLSV